MGLQAAARTAVAGTNYSSIWSGKAKLVVEKIVFYMTNFTRLIVWTKVAAHQ
jgi:hypothetical protein